jgi:hypothetical protein
VGRSLDKKVPVTRIVAGTLLALMLVAAASYAAARHGGGHGLGPGPGHGKKRHEPAGEAGAPGAGGGSAALRIDGHPPAISTRSTVRFHIEAPPESTLRCRLDRHPARECEASVLYRGVGAGPHTFYVSSLRSGGTVARASFSWTMLEPKPFTVSPRPDTIGPLYPGAEPSPVPVTITNPNSVSITVTALRVIATGGAPGCAPADNLALTAPALAGGKLRIAARGSVSLPTATVAAPTIGLRELPVDQDACKSASFDLAFSGSAGA